MNGRPESAVTGNGYIFIRHQAPYIPLKVTTACRGALKRILAEYGFELSMDDFGAGYSSLNSLKDLPLDGLKIDAEFFRAEEEKERGDIIVGEAIQLAKLLNMRTVAEGIETKEQIDFLADHGCDMIQGFYYAKPMPVNEFEATAFNAL